LLAMCYPPFDMWGLVWVALVPLFVSLWAGGGERRRGWFGFGTGCLAGAAFWLVNLRWILEVTGLGWVVVAIYLAMYFGVWGAFAAGAGNPWRERRRGAAREAGRIEAKVLERTERMERTPGLGGKVLLFGAMNAGRWCGLEWVRGWFLTGFGWNGLGVTFHETPVLAQGADLVGVTGLAFLPVFVTAVVVQAGRGLHREVRSGRWRAHWEAGVAMAVLAACFLYGVWKIESSPAGAGAPLHVLMVQLNIPQEAHRVVWEPERVHAGYEEETLEALEALDDRNAARVEAAMRAAPGRPVRLDVPDWVVWPESALPVPLLFTPQGDQAVVRSMRTTLDRVLPAGAFTLVLGLNEAEAVEEAGIYYRKEDGKFYNSILALPAGEERFRSYRKQHLVLFGETIPYREYFPFLDWLFRQSAGVDFTGSFDRGKGDEPLAVPFGRLPGREIEIIPTICFEDTVPRHLRKYVLNGGQVIVNVTNDGWFGRSEAAAQHFANARFRCIELRRPMVRCSNTGVTAVVGATGSVVDPRSGERRILAGEEGSHFTRGWLFATAYVPAAGPVTMYARFGEWFAAAGLAAGLGWWVWAWRRGRGRSE